MSSLLTTSFIQDEVKDQFGYDVMELEATNSIISRSIDRCLRTLNVYKPKISRYSLTDVETSDDTVAYVESMKVLNAITADQDGTVDKILVKHGDDIDEDTPLIVLS